MSSNAEDSGGVFTQREDLPHQHAEGPHITLCGVDLVKDGLGRHPLQGEPGLRARRDGHKAVGFPLSL